MLATVASEWVSAVSTTIVAVIALLGWLIKAICAHLTRPIISFVKSKNYDYHLPSENVQLASGAAIPFRTEYLGAIQNEGKRVALNCTVSINCILTKGEDGDSWHALYYGMPLKVKWHPNKNMIDIPGGAVEYFRFITFQSGASGENAGDKVDSEDVKICSVLYESEDESLTRINLSIGQPVTSLIRVASRALNTNSEVSGWLFVHWSGGGTVTKKNFKIRLAKEDECAQANAAYEVLCGKGDHT